MKINKSRIAVVAVVAASLPMALGVAAAQAGNYDTEAEGSFQTQDRQLKFSFDVHGDEDSGFGRWSVRNRFTGDYARGVVLCVSGSDQNKREYGETASMVVRITRSDFPGGSDFEVGDELRLDAQDSPGPDGYRLDPGNDNCRGDDFDQDINLDNIRRGDIDVDVDN